MSVQTYPFPWNPELHVQMKDEREFEQDAIAEQLLPIAQKLVLHENPPGKFTHVVPFEQL